ncbi:hypothetical protein J4218_03305 [Candidatus Pacearchaeota archaeon]|nr:hypothetical protein [Candidatus Pacearchaeota archaeon]
MKTGLKPSTKSCMIGIFVIIVVVLMGNVLAVTASIGNARMILRAQVGDTIEKSILVKNVNNESVKIEIFASGDLVKDIKILDSNFTLEPGEEKDARFTIKITKEGAFENKINVKFTSFTEGKGVALSSNVVVMVLKDNESISPDTNDSLDNTDNTDNTGENTIKPIGPLVLLLSITGIILLIFFVVLIVYYSKAGKKEKEENNSDVKEENKKESDKGRKGNIIKSKKRAKK